MLYAPQTEDPSLEAIARMDIEDACAVYVQADDWLKQMEPLRNTKGIGDDLEAEYERQAERKAAAKAVLMAGGSKPRKSEPPLPQPWQDISQWSWSDMPDF